MACACSTRTCHWLNSVRDAPGPYQGISSPLPLLSERSSLRHRPTLLSVVTTVFPPPFFSVRYTLNLAQPFSLQWFPHSQGEGYPNFYPQSLQQPTSDIHQAKCVESLRRFAHMPSHTPSDRCTYRDIAGRRCRLPRKPTHPDLCAHHARINPEQTIENPQALVAEVLGPSPDFCTAKAVNRTAGKLLEALLAGRIPARHAAIAGYLCQLIIQTLPQLRIEAQPERGAPTSFQFVTLAPRPDYS